MSLSSLFYTHICIYTHMYICVCIHIYVYVCVCVIYIYYIFEVFQCVRGNDWCREGFCSHICPNTPPLGNIPFSTTLHTQSYRTSFPNPPSYSHRVLSMPLSFSAISLFNKRLFLIYLSAQHSFRHKSAPKLMQIGRLTINLATYYLIN